MKIPGYRIERLIGRGGTSSVYLAVQISLNRQVALKVMKKFDDPRRIERFMHEGRVIASLNHRNIITIYDVGTVRDRHFIAMEYLHGGSLSEKIDEGLPLPKILSLLEQVAACLHFVHRRGIIHRDIKPGNILFHADGTPKLTDFGIAKLIDNDQELTMDGSAIGSPYYLSPEQAQGEPLDGRSDIYALGIVFYQLLTGKRPYAKNTPLETVVAHLTQPLPMLPRQYAAYQGLLERMIAKEPVDRFATAKELAYRVRELKEQASPETVRKPPRAIAAPDEREPLGLRKAVTWGLSGLFVSVGLFLLAGPHERANGPQDLALTPIDKTGPRVLVEAVRKAPVDDLRATSSRSAAEATAVVSSMPATGGSGAAIAIAGEPAPGASPVEASVVDRQQHEMRLVDPEAETTAVRASALPTHAAPTATDMVTVPVDNATASAAEPAGEHEQAAAAADNTVQEQVNDLMQAAQRALQRARLTRPRDDNAYRYFREVLEIDPGHAGARRGLRTIADRYAAMARRALRRDQDGKALLYVSRGLDIQPNHSRLITLRSELERRRAEAGPAQVAAAEAMPEAAETAQRDSIRGEGSGNIVKDFKRVWRAVFN